MYTESGLRHMRLVMLLSALAALLSQTIARAEADAPSGVSTHLAGISVPFVPNAGQWDKRVAFRAESQSSTVWVTRSADIVYELDATRDSDVSTSQTNRSPTSRRARQPSAWALVEQFVRPLYKRLPTATGQDETVAHVSFFQGQVETGRLATFKTVDLGAIWPGVHVKLRSGGGNFEKVFMVAPHGDPAKIEVDVNGTGRLEIMGDGTLQVAVGGGSVNYTAPIAYQETDGQRTYIPVAYSLSRISGAVARHRYGFKIGEFDHNRELIIDPLLQSTYLGDSSPLLATSAVDPASGNLYVAGTTFSVAFPGTVGGAIPVNNGGYEYGSAFVALLSADLKTLLQATYLGGSGGAQGGSIAIHPKNGDIYVSGSSASDDFPGVAGGAQKTSHGDNLFLARLNRNLTQLVNATYVGGTPTPFTDPVYVVYRGINGGIAVSANDGDVYILGSTTAKDIPHASGGGQASAGPYQNFNAFVSRYSADLSRLVQSTYFGAEANTFGYALALNPANDDVYAAGVTGSVHLPHVRGGAQSVPGMGTEGDGFVARFDKTLTKLLQSSYLGGDGDDQVKALAIARGTGDVYLAGATSSTDFPATLSSFQPVLHPGEFRGDAFVARMNSGLTKLQRSTYIGGSDIDVIWSMAIHPLNGNIYLGGMTTSADFPVSINAIQPIFGGGESALDGDAFIASVSPDLERLVDSTYIGGSADDVGYSLGISPQTGDVFLTGTTGSHENFPGTNNGYQPTCQCGDGSNETTFVTKVSSDLSGLYTPSVDLDQHGLTGSWFNPATGGQGFEIEVYPDVYGAGHGLLFAGWFTYDITAANGRRWYGLTGNVSNTAPTADLQIFDVEGGNLNAPPSLGAAGVLGQATIRFSDCNTGSLMYAFTDSSGRSGTIPLSRLTPNVQCTQGGDVGIGTDNYLLSGNWFSPDKSGQGLMFDVSPSIHNIFAAWYTFKPNGQQVGGSASQDWFTLQSDQYFPLMTSIDNIAIVETSGGVFDSPTPATVLQAGIASIVFQSCNNMTLTYQFTGGKNAGLTGSMNLVRVGPTPMGCNLP